MIHFAHFYSQISYGIIFWGSFLQLRNVFIMQKRAIRFMLRLGPRSSCTESFKILDVLTFPSLYIYALMLFAVKNLNIYKTNFSVHCVNTRQQNKLHIPLVRLSSIHRGFYYSSVKIFDQLPQNVLKFCNNIHNFNKTLLETTLLKMPFIPLRNFYLLVIMMQTHKLFILNLFYYFVYIYFFHCNISYSY